MLEIIPAIMPETFKEVEEKIGPLRKLIKSVHIDVMDGSITSSKNWPFTDEGLEEMKKITGGEIGLPYWKDINYEVDLMMQNPEESFAEWVNAGFHRIIIHSDMTQKLFFILKEWAGVVEIGVAVGIETDNEDVYKYVDAGADFIQFMGIYQIGFQGNPFDMRVLEKIKKMREVYPNIPISADGGVNMNTARQLLEAGADRLVIGSAIFKKNEFEGKDLIQEAASAFDSREVVDISGTDSAYSGVAEALNGFKKLASDFSAEKAKKI
ncbi:MAG: HisA/HisF-related TIM barrel protein [Candidatus Paceibacterota bacterium]|jgi:ribulose-phosphate 3-epimerase